MQIILMHNPEAGRSEHEAEYLMGLFERSGHKTRYQSTKEQEWEKALEESADAVVVAGGDGTVGKVARLLIDRRLPLAILPIGTANNIARTLELVASPEQLIAQLEGASREPFDVAHAIGPWGKRYWLEGAGAGLLPDYLDGVASFVDAVSEREPLAKDEEMARHISVLRNVLSSYEPCDWQVTVDGEDMSGSYLLLETMNIRSIGPVLMLAPHARTDDGQLDFVSVRETDRSALAAYFESRLRNQTAEFPFPSRPCRSVRMSWQGSSLHFDDKLWPRKDQPGSSCEIEFGIEPSALEILRLHVLQRA